MELLDNLKKRMKELDEMEKQLLANYNALVGAKQECARMIGVLEAKPEQATCSLEAPVAQQARAVDL